MRHPFDLTGRIALVTGGGGGLGLAIARGLANAGATVVLNGRNRAKLVAAAAHLAAGAAPPMIAPFDVTDAAAVAEGVARVESDLGRIDILVNNAAIVARAPIDAIAVDVWHALLAANLDGPFHVTRAVLAGMKARRLGKIVNLCSLSSDLGRPEAVAYAVTKGGLKQFTRGLAVELAPHNIQVNGIVPGFFRTDMNAPLVADAAFSEWVCKRTPAGRWGEPGDIAGAAVFLASPAADYVTGHLLHVDGGFAASY